MFIVIQNLSNYVVLKQVFFKKKFNSLYFENFQIYLNLEIYQISVIQNEFSSIT